MAIGETISKILGQGVKEAFNANTLKSAEHYFTNTLSPLFKEEGWKTALIGEQGLLPTFKRFASGPNLEGSARTARMIGSYGALAGLGIGTSVGAYSAGKRLIQNGGDFSREHPGLTAIGIGGGVWAATAGRGAVKSAFGRAQKLAAAGIAKISSM